MPSKTLDRVVDRLESVTRYPRQILAADADIENGLGIDSVKFVEILLELSEEFDVELQGHDRDPSVKTISDLADWIDGILTDNAPRAAPQPPAPQPEPPQPAQARANGHGSPAPRFDPPAAAAPRPHTLPAGANGAHHTAPSEDADNNTRPLVGKVALVTGGGRGVGRTIARVLASRGATVLVNSFHSRDQGEEAVAEIRAAGGQAAHLWGSVANPDHVDEIFATIDRDHGLDILVCNASDGRIGSFQDLTFDDWDRAFRTNVAGHHRCAVHAARLMRQRGGGSIVTLSAVGAHGFIDGLGAQGVAKAAVESLTRYLAYEFSGDGVRVNCVAGGPVYGDLLSKFQDARATQDYWESMVPDGQLCSPLDLAQTIAFLVSEEARCINGAVWMVDHGFSASGDGQRRRRVSPEAVLSTVS